MCHSARPADLEYCVSAGLTSQQAAERLVKYGRNAVNQSKPPSTLALMYRSLFEPFNGVMLVVAILTAVPPNSSYSTFALIMVISATSLWLNLGCPSCASSSCSRSCYHAPCAVSTSSAHRAQHESINLMSLCQCWIAA
jgi:hypothetical protein